jgi:DNA-binding NarL/FixJ family response regulator
MPVDDRPVAAPSAEGVVRRQPDAETPRAVRLALLDDHEVLLDSMASWIRTNAADFDVVLTATTWLQLVHSPMFPTDLVLLDVQPREPVSIEARVRSCRAAGAKVIVLTGLDSLDMRERALRAGAAAFLGKSRTIAEVMAVARSVMGRAAGGAAPREWRPLPQAAEPVARPRLSLGEEAALRLYASGRSTREVAVEMRVQFETAKTYLRRVREKYARVDRPASRKADLIQRATEDGYI